MMTAACNNDVLESRHEAQNETFGSEVRFTDAEIMRRVRDIKSTWSPTERDQRRAEAERRFDNLVDTIFDAAA